MARHFRIIASAFLLAMPAFASAALPVVEVFKSATCGCCEGWTTHLKEQGFTVKTSNVANPSDYREKFGIPTAMGSCHTARIGAYVIEGHVPASDIKRLLQSGVKARGLAVPAMPMGSPGMEGDRSDPYDVFLIQPDGRTTVYKHYNGKS
ncbi:MAG TPA: DUF411 domain-containing protein [Telluria sp.]|jgi:hypothetical protein